MAPSVTDKDHTPCCTAGKISQLNRCIATCDGLVRNVCSQNHEVELLTHVVYYSEGFRYDVMVALLAKKDIS